MLHLYHNNVISHYCYYDSILICDNRFIIIIAQHYYQVHNQNKHIATYLPLSLLTVVTVVFDSLITGHIQINTYIV